VSIPRNLQEALNDPK